RSGGGRQHTAGMTCTPLVATRHPVAKVKQFPFSLSRCSDFTLLPGRSLTSPLPRSYLPYQYCPEVDEYYMVHTPKSACSAPFLYLAQYQQATGVVRLPRQRLARYLPHVDTSARCTSVLIFSIGRCGSTLLSRLLARLGYFCFSESDIYTGLAGIADANVRRHVILETTSMLLGYSGVACGDVVIKMRAQCNASFADIRAALPIARYVF